MLMKPALRHDLTSQLNGRRLVRDPWNNRDRIHTTVFKLLLDIPWHPKSFMIGIMRQVMSAKNIWHGFVEFSVILDLFQPALKVIDEPILLTNTLHEPDSGLVILTDIHE